MSSFLQSKLTANDGAEDDLFGYSVAIYGDTVIVGADMDDESRGAAYIFVREDDDAADNDNSNNNWIQQAKLVANDREFFRSFGIGVAIYEDTAIIGSYLDDVNGDFSGSAYLFVRENDSWSQQAKIVANDGSRGDFFGYAVGIYDNTVVVGAPDDDENGDWSGSAYVFVKDTTNNDWIQKAKLVADDGARLNYFGHSVGIYGDTIIIGAYGHTAKGTDSGSAYIFSRDSKGNWSQQVKLLASDGQASDYFGRSVAIHEDTVIIGSDGDDDYGERSGSAYIFVRSSDGWIEETKLEASDEAPRDAFGSSVGIYGHRAVVGAFHNSDNGQWSGSAYIFAREAVNNTWIEKNKLVADDGAEGDEFGISVGIYGGTVIVGASGDADNGNDSGSAYVFFR